MPEMPSSPKSTSPPPALAGGELLTFEEAAKICTVSYETFRRWVAKGVLPYVVVHTERRIRRSDVDALMRFVDNRDAQ